MTLNEISDVRLISQKVASPEFKTPGEIVRWMGAMQAQDYSMAKWAIGVRRPIKEKKLTYSLLRERVPPNEVRKRTSVHLLPAFDEFLIAYRDRNSSLSPIFNKKTVSVNGIFYPLIVVNGQVTGLWKRITQKNKIIISTDFFQPPDKLISELLEKKMTVSGQFSGRETIINNTKHHK